MHTLFALTIGGGGINNYNAPTYTIQTPKQVPVVELQALISLGLNLLLFAAVLLAFVFVLIGGIKWLTSQGDKKEVEGAQKTITYAIIGLVVVFASFFILNLIGYAVGITNPLIGNQQTIGK